MGAKKRPEAGQAAPVAPVAPVAPGSELDGAPSRLGALIDQASSHMGDLAHAPVDETELFCFRIRDRSYAVPMHAVAEVVTNQPTAEIPFAPIYIRGVFNRHGNVTAVLDLATFMGVEGEAQPNRLIVLESGDLEAAVPISEVIGIDHVPTANIEPPLPHLTHESGFITGQFARGELVLSVLDVEILLESSRHKRTWDRVP